MRRGGPAALAACLAGALAVLAGPGLGPGSVAWGGRRPPRSYSHLEGDVRWRRLFSATRFFLCIDGGGGVEGTRWRERPGSIMEIRSVRVGVVAIRAVHTGFYLAMNRRGRLYGSTERTEVEANALDPACSHAGTWHCWDAALPHPAEQSRHGAARAARSPLRQLPSSRLRLQQPNRAGVVLPTASLQGPGRGEAQRREGTETAGPGRAGRLRLSCVQALAEIKATFTLQKGERVWELRLLGLARVATGPFSTIAASSDSPGVAVAATGIGPGPGPGHPRPNLPPGSTGVAFPAAQSREQGEGRGSPGFAGRGWVEAHA
ncbi:fibroblast growth factor 22 isoform X5 [Dromaius novaehollandiae]|uniref:fibroblast growth factor 22 isoform X5 n=1 Tax=Dromaius novaehollandiae TaxID=8790 RepID=UPI00311E70D5